MTRIRRWIDMLWPAALLLVFLGTFRRTIGTASGDQAPIRCVETEGLDLAMLERCLAFDSRDVELLAAIGDVEAASGASVRAEEMYRRALAIDPHDGTVHLRLGELLLARGDVEGARIEGQAALKSLPGHSGAERLIARATTESRP
jgi:predicted Zn-dependent protease